jgi:4-diphosphocytidyl-2-C-methyl-D-erythritol kinase
VSGRRLQRRGERGARVRLEARAKLNLGLAVGPRRDDGFHELATIFQSISLSDTLIVAPRRRGFSLTVRFEDASARARSRRERMGASRSGPRDFRVPEGASNLALRAVRLLDSRHRLPGGARLSLIKRIPAGAGLGGGSADAAAALVGLTRLYRTTLSRVDLLALAAELGSDVPFALMGGTALGTGRGERLRRMRLARPFRALLAVPSWRVATAGAFRALARRRNALTLWRPKLRFAQSLGRKAIRPVQGLRLGNAFEDVLGERRSDFLSLCARLRRAGADEPHLTGSGSAVFGIIPAGVPGQRVVERFSGNELIYLIRSRGKGLT